MDGHVAALLAMTNKAPIAAVILACINHTFLKKLFFTERTEARTEDTEAKHLVCSVCSVGLAPCSLRQKFNQFECEISGLGSEVGRPLRGRRIGVRAVIPTPCGF